MFHHIAKAAVLAATLAAAVSAQDIHPSTSYFATFGPLDDAKTVELHPEVWCNDGDKPVLLFHCSKTITIPADSNSCDVCEIIASAINNDPGCQAKGFSVTCDGAKLTVSNSSIVDCEDAFVCFDPAAIQGIRADMAYSMVEVGAPIWVSFWGEASGDAFDEGVIPTVQVLHDPIGGFTGGEGRYATVVQVVPGMTGADIAQQLAIDLGMQSDHLASQDGGSVRFDPQIIPSVIPDQGSQDPFASGSYMDIPEHARPVLGTPGHLGLYDLTVLVTAEGIGWAIGPSPNLLNLWGLAVDLAEPAHHRLGGTPLAMGTGDFNGDGYPDLAILESELGFSIPNPLSVVSVRFNEGTGSFGPETRYLLGSLLTNGSAATDMAVGDLDGDGDIDLLVADPGQGLVTLSNNGAGVFGIQPPDAAALGGTQLVLGQLDGDGLPDCVVSMSALDEVLIIRTTTANVSVAVGDRPGPLGLGDIDNDGDDDIVVGHDSSAGLLVLRQVAGNFFTGASAAGTAIADLDVADVDGDGRHDVAFARTLGSGVGLAHGEVDGSLSIGIDSDGPVGVTSVKLPLLAGTTRDLVAASPWSPSLMVSLGSGAGTFQDATQYALNGTLGLGGDLLDTADLNADGLLDILVGQAFSSRVSVLLQTAP